MIKYQIEQTSILGSTPSSASKEITIKLVMSSNNPEHSEVILNALGLLNSTPEPESKPAPEQVRPAFPDKMECSNLHVLHSNLKSWVWVHRSKGTGYWGCRKCNATQRANQRRQGILR